MSWAVELEARITSYLSLGGLFNPEMANHDAVRDLLIDCRAEFATLRSDNERLGLERDADIDALHGTFSKPIAVLQERVEAAEAERDTLLAQVEKMRNELEKACGITEAHVRSLLINAHASAGSYEALAKQIGLSDEFIRQCCRGERAITGKVLRWLGFELLPRKYRAALTKEPS